MSFTYRKQLTIEWGQCDPAGIVFNSRFFEMFDASTWQMFEAALGVKPYELAGAFGIMGLPLVDVRANFIKAVKFGDVVDISSRVSEFRRSSFDVEHRLSVAGLLAVEGGETRVWASRSKDDPEKIAGTAIPGEVIAKFAGTQSFHPFPGIGLGNLFGGARCGASIPLCYTRIMTKARRRCAQEGTKRLARLLECRLNSRDRADAVADNILLLDYLREKVGLTGTKTGCDGGECGACTVLIDDTPTLSCLTLAMTVQGKRVDTIESLGVNGQLSAVQRGFHEKLGSQCGYCTPGFIMASAGLLRKNPDPSEAEIFEALGRNICRCTGYVKIIEAVKFAVALGKQGIPP